MPTVDNLVKFGLRVFRGTASAVLPEDPHSLGQRNLCTPTGRQFDVGEAWELHGEANLVGATGIFTHAFGRLRYTWPS